MTGPRTCRPTSDEIDDGWWPPDLIPQGLRHGSNEPWVPAHDYLLYAVFADGKRIRWFSADDLSPAFDQAFDAWRNVPA